MILYVMHYYIHNVLFLSRFTINATEENKEWTYECIMDAYSCSRNMVAGVAKRFVMEGMKVALGRKK